MGANNWRICPRCQRRAEQAREKAMAQAAASYSKVDAETWRLASEAAHQPIELTETFSEYYELGTTLDGTFYVSYGGDCSACKFVVEFDHKEKREIND